MPRKMRVRDGYFNSRQLGKLLDIGCTRTLVRRSVEGRLPMPVQDGGQYFWAVDAVRKHLDAERRRA